MLIASNSRGQRCIAWESEKSDGPYYCPECGDQVILRKGRIKAHHYAHRPPFECKYGAGESELHMRAKREIYNALVNHPQCRSCALERRLEGVRPDVSLHVGEVPVAIEMQRSDLSVQEITERTRRYAALNIAVLWVVPGAIKPRPRVNALDGDVATCRPTAWQKMLHAMYFGRLYYWSHSAYVIPIHFAPYSYWVDVRDWYDEDGEARSAGGYWKDSKAERIIEPSRAVHIAESFAVRLREPFSTRSCEVPRCRVWLDTLSKWWS